MAKSARESLDVPATTAPAGEPLAAVLSSQFARLGQTRPPLSCLGTSGQRYILALSVRGQYQECLAYAERCARRSEAMAMRTLVQGARCAVALQQHRRALDLFRQGATLRAFRRADDASFLLMEYATFTEFGIYPRLTNAVVELHPRWRRRERGLALAAVRLLKRGDVTAEEKLQARQFIEEQLVRARGAYADWLKVARLSIAHDEGEIPRAVQLLREDAPTLVNPLDWWVLGYRTLYRAALNANFAAATALYQAFLPHAHSRSWLPTEQNVLTYAQIRQSACPATLLQGEGLGDFQAVLARWREGSLGIDELRADLRARLALAPTAADLLTAQGDLLSLGGDPAGARAHYWRAHQACPQYNRAHWGLELLNRDERYAGYPEYARNEARLREVVARTQLPAEAAQYFVNWPGLPEAARARVTYGTRLWAPYIRELHAHGLKTYIKLPFEILSDAPGMHGLRDARIGPPTMPSYRNDNRLWDDVRGAGGATVVADLHEIQQAVHGGYNLLTHEIAHQFHHHLQNARPDLYQCLERLYAAARGRNRFPDAYAASNVKEYFAQGATYHMVPADSPARYGLNASWLPANDPDLHRFLQSVEASQGDLSRVECPLP